MIIILSTIFFQDGVKLLFGGLPFFCKNLNRLVVVVDSFTDIFRKEIKFRESHEYYDNQFIDSFFLFPQLA